MSPKRPLDVSEPKRVLGQGVKDVDVSELSAGVLERYKRLETLLDWLYEVPEDWITAITKTEVAQLKPRPCSRYKDLVSVWKRALRWRQDMDDVLSVLLSVAASTVQQGDQLFVMLIGDPGGGKTRFCDAMLVSKHCFPLEHLTGFFSGFKGGDDDEDYSVITRANRKVMITPEGDVLMSNPKAREIMAQQRRIFDGVSGATYKNRKEDLRYAGLRTPWIMAGTPALLDMDQSRLGDRFLKVFLERPAEEERLQILNRVSRSAFNAVQATAEGEDLIGAELRAAYETTGGYIDYLRENTHLLSQITCEDKHFDTVEALADLVSFLRARPSVNEDGEATRDQPTRLTSQFVRLMTCLTYVLNRTRVDQEVMRRVCKVALDSGKGICYEICNLLVENNNKYMPNKLFHLKLDYSNTSIDKQLKLLKQLGGVQLSLEDPTVKPTSKPFWRLAPRLYNLMKLAHSI